jgi:hypothetical protein
MNTTDSSSTTLHLFLTRFNVKSGGKEKRLRENPTWLADRFELFDRFCWPSMTSQTRTDFIWVVFFDSQTPDEFMKRIEACREFLPFHPVFVDEWNTEFVHETIRGLIGPRYTNLLTSRLDNDDAIHRCYVETLRNAISTERPGFYLFPDGAIYNRGQVFRHRDESNAFASYYEPVKDFKTVWSIQHDKLLSTGPANHVSLPHAWFQVVHGSNVSNRVKGELIQRNDWIDGYRHLTKVDVAPDSKTGILIDRCLGAPLRRAREILIRVIKPILRRKRTF